MKALLVVILVAIVSSSMVSAAVVLLRPIQLNNKLLDHSRNIMQLTALLPEGETLPDSELLELFKSLDVRWVDLDTGEFVVTNQAKQAGTVVSVYLVWRDNVFERIILPISGEGMWSTLYGYIALAPDLNTIAGATFYEQNETPGLGDQVTRPDWLAQWEGRRIYDENGEPRFAVSGARVDPASSAALYEVDALTGATVTADAVSKLVQHGFGPDGFRPFLTQMSKSMSEQTLSESSVSEDN